MRFIVQTVVAVGFLGSSALSSAACDETLASAANSVFIPVSVPNPTTPTTGVAPLIGTVSASPAPVLLAPQEMPMSSGAVQPLKTAQVMPDMPMAVSVDPWADILTRYIRQDAGGLARVGYKALRASTADMQALSAYIKTQSQARPSIMPRGEAMAYWANLYNALTVQVVAQNYPVKSIRDIKSGARKGPWKRKLIMVEGDMLSLDTIEHDIMRPTFKTPLVHYMVNCASIGCPNLKSSPWQAASLDADLEAAARAYINSPRGAVFSGGNLRVSKIYKWFKKDFGGNNAGVLIHLKQYANADLRKQLESYGKIDKYIYDWGVNAP